MGMAASQARYLALTARKSNCEYEGQQINQARLALANQSANLFNQMLGLNVPVPPSTLDFTKKQYSFTDGINPSVIDSWKQLATPDDNGYNYVVDYHYEAEVQKGFERRMNDPQVQFAEYVPVDETTVEAQQITVNAIYAAQRALKEAQAAYDTAENNYTAMRTRGANFTTYRDRTAYAQRSVGWDNVANQYFVNTDTTGDTKDVYLASFKDITGYATLVEAEANYDTLTDNQKAALNAVKTWVGDGIDVDEGRLYFTTNKDEVTDGKYITLTENPSIVLYSDIADMVGSGGNSTTLPVYNIGTPADEGTNPYTIYGMQTAQNNLLMALQDRYDDLQTAQMDVDGLNLPKFAGNTELTSLGELTESQMAAIKQIIVNMTENGADCNFTRCFTSSLNLNPENYTGGIYEFVRDGQTYYTTYFDLADAAIKSTFTNDIDNQPKLNYYYTTYVTDKIYTSDKAVLDTDSRGRFKTVRFQNSSNTYTLNYEEVTDDEAYADAMNQYYYENAKYDKMVQDINAKTSIIQQEDRTLELRLKQLDTEQNALKTEMEAVQKVIKDNVEATFKTFGG